MKTIIKNWSNCKEKEFENRFEYWERIRIEESDWNLNWIDEYKYQNEFK